MQKQFYDFLDLIRQVTAIKRNNGKKKEWWYEKLKRQ
jgi:hypothetical protein